MKSSYLLFVLLFAIFIGSCNKDEDKEKTVTLIAVSDGYVSNTNPRAVIESFDGLCGKNIQIGWNNAGKALRGFVTFDITPILPGDGEVLTINSSVLKVNECNTNLHPFDGDGGSRTVQAHLVEYGILDANDYNIYEINTCGTIATTGYNVLQEHSFDVKNAVSTYYERDPDNITTFQFRFQFTNDANIANPDVSELDGSTWSFFAEESGDQEYRPRLEIVYTLKNV